MAIGNVNAFTPSVSAGFYLQSAEKAAEKKTPELSDNAQKLLSELKDKYKSVDFIVSDFSSDEEADRLLSQGSGEYNCLISPDMLEKMAADENIRQQYEGIISGAGDDFDKIRETLGDNAENVKRLGMSVDGNGEVNYYALLKNGLPTFRQGEQNAEKAKTGKGEKADGPKGIPGNGGKTLVRGSTVDELLARIYEVGASRVEKAEEQQKRDDGGSGSQIRVDGFKGDDDITGERNDGFRDSLPEYVPFGTRGELPLPPLRNEGTTKVDTRA